MPNSGQTKAYIVPDTEEAIRFVRTCLKRRQSAPKRIGIAYEIVRKLIGHLPFEKAPLYHGRKSGECDYACSLESSVVSRIKYAT